MAKQAEKQPDFPIDQKAPSRIGKKRKKRKGVIILVLIIGIMGITGFIFKKPINNFLAKNLANVPVVNQWFKPETDQDPYGNTSKQQLITELEEKKIEISSLEEAQLVLEKENMLLQEKISSLKTYEDKYSEFLEQKEEWDKEIAKTDPKLFIAQIEKMYPDMAKEIYQEIKIDDLLTKEQKSFSSTIGQMEEEQAAKALEVLIPTDPELIKVIFEGMQAERKSLILSSMTSANAARVIKLLSPE